MTSETTTRRIRDRLLARVKANARLHFSQTPSLRDLAREFRCTQEEILDILEDHPDVEIVAGARSALGTGAFAKGDWKFEWVGEDDEPQAAAA